MTSVPMDTREQAIEQCDPAELIRLRAIQAAALRVASSVRDGVCLDRGALKLLDDALEARGPL